MVDDNAKAGYLLTLGGIIGTIGAGYLAFIGVRNQIQDTGDIETENREATHVADRAMLPLALTRMIDVCENNIRRNYDPADLIFGGGPATTLKEFDAESMAIMEEAIKSAPKANKEALAHIIRLYQVVRARTSAVDGKALATPHLDDPMKDWDRNNDALNWAAVGAVVGHAFPYARSMAAGINRASDPDTVRSALLGAGLDFDIFPNLGKLFDTRRQRGGLFVI